MFIAFIVQVVVCVLILRWLLRKKTGEPYSKKSIIRFLGAGMLALVVGLAVSLLLKFNKEYFFGLNPVLAGFLTALLTAALYEEVIKYIMFRLALIRNKEVISWLDVIIAAIIVGIGFTLLEDVEFAVSGATNFLRAVFPAHLLFQGIMGYYYGKARVTRKRIYDVLSLLLPILAHALFDMFLISLRSILGDLNSVQSLTEEQLIAIPNWEYVVPLLICAAVVMVAVLIALIVMLRKISAWSRKGEKQESLN